MPIGTCQKCGRKETEINIGNEPDLYICLDCFLNEKGENMKPPKREDSFEKVAIGEFITGEIEEIQYDMEHKFTYQGKETITSAVRFIFRLDGYAFNHYSRWMKFMVGAKSNLYKKYLSKLVEGINPDADFDLDHLKGMRIKTIWEEQNNYQNIENIFPENKKIPFTTEEVEPEEETEQEKEAEG